jgi:hypothetical protein
MSRPGAAVPDARLRRPPRPSLMAANTWFDGGC